MVVDKGLTTGDNIWYILSAKNGYVLSYSIRSADKDFQLREEEKFDGYYAIVTSEYKEPPKFIQITKRADCGCARLLSLLIIITINN